MTSETVPILTELLREGRTFAVHRGVLADDTRVICKAVSDRSAGSAAAQRLENEFSITRGLTHRGHARALFITDTDRGRMLVFGDEGLKSLDQRGPGPMDPEEVRLIGRKIAEALQDLHGHGIIHRDVQPSNIIASADCQTVRLIDYCLATRTEDLAHEDPGSFAALGTVAFMAPEQSGRMNRQVDERADLYSLGVTLYALLTGQRPFLDQDPARLVFRHMTEVPPPPDQVHDEVPEDLSAAVMMLIEKNPEDRFQSAAEFLEAIEPGQKRLSVKLSMPDRLYGRERTIQSLAAEIKSGLAGPSRFFRVAGPSGIGKSALIQVIVEAAAADGAEVLLGKFDQLDRARPYGAIKQAVSMLLRQLMAAPGDELETWRERILDAVHPNGQVLLDLLPDYASLLGEQPAVAELGLNEQRIRTELVFRRFIQVLARVDRPLIMVLDDLQWSDSASRALMRLLLTDPEIRNLTLVTAYRDNEVDKAHPVARLFDDLRDLGRLGTLVQPEPLDQRHIALLLADCLGQPQQEVMGLAALIAIKTAGNPFFVRQFLLALDQKDLLSWDGTEERWRWDLERIQTEAITDNVADLVSERLMDLPPETHRIMQLAACFGNDFEAETLALAEGRAPFHIAQLLKPALEADVIRHKDDDAHGERRGGRYRFQHDRVQTAAYGSLTAEQQSHLHARIGGVLLNRTSGAEIGQWLIEITDHLIAGKRHLDAPLRLCLRDLALASAKRTRQSNAWDASLRYLGVAEEMLGPEGWSLDPSLMFDVTLQKAEGAYLQSHDARASAITKDLLSRDLPMLNRVRVLELQVLIQCSKLNYRGALRVGHQALALLGQRLPKSPGAGTVMLSLLRTKLLLRGQKPNDLLNLPPMSDPVKLAVIRVLGLMAAPAYFTEQHLLPVIGMQIVDLSVRHGNAPHSPYGYVIYGMLHCAALGRPEQGMAYADVAREAAIELGAADTECRVLMVYGGFVQHWTAPMAETLPVFREAWEKAIATGDLEYHGYARYGHASYALMAGKSLGHVAELLDEHLAAVIDHTHEKTQRIMTMARASIARMRGQEPDPAHRFNAEESIALWSDQRDATSLAYLHKYRMLEALMAGDYAEVLTETEEMTDNLNGILSMAYEPFYRFYEALASAELAREARGARRKALIARARRQHRRLKDWSRNAPQTFGHRKRLIQAELAALAGKTREAITGFEDAIAQARQTGALHDVGLFHERAARFYLAQGGEGAAAGHLAEARGAFGIWGGTGWIEALDARYADTVQAEAALWRGSDAAAAHPAPSGGQIVDSATLVAAAAALAKKTSLTDVIEEVMRAIVVNAGADRGVLALRDETELSVVAEASGSAIRLIEPETLEDFDALPLSVVNYVHRTSTQLVMDDAVLDPNFGQDPFIKAHHPSSILCVPLLAKG
ncbi:MAG: AAA family ATPase, partial [Pseudomonadota bacterium]